MFKLCRKTNNINVIEDNTNNNYIQYKKNTLDLELKNKQLYKENIILKTVLSKNKRYITNMKEEYKNNFKKYYNISI